MFRLIYLPNTYVSFEYPLLLSDGTIGSLTIRLHTRNWQYNHEILSNYNCFNPTVFDWLIARIEAEFPEAYQRFLVNGRLILFTIHTFTNPVRPYTSNSSQ